MLRCWVFFFLLRLISALQSDMPRRTGLTLVEVLIVVVLMSIVAAVVVVQFTDVVAETKVDVAALTFPDACPYRAIQGDARQFIAVGHTCRTGFTDQHIRPDRIGRRAPLRSLYPGHPEKPAYLVEPSGRDLQVAGFGRRCRFDSGLALQSCDSGTLDQSPRPLFGIVAHAPSRGAGATAMRASLHRQNHGTSDFSPMSKSWEILRNGDP